MKRLLSLTVLALTTLSAFAQKVGASSIEVLDRIGSESVSFDYTYSVATFDQPSKLRQTSSGTVTAQREAYCVTGLGLEVRSDDKDRWTIDPAAQEVLIESVGKGVADDLLLTPTLAVCRYSDYFTSSFAGRQFVSDGYVDRFDLTPIHPTADLQEVYLLVMTDDGDLQDGTVRLAFGFRGSDSSWIEIRTSQLQFAPRKDLSFYRPAPGAFDGPEWVVTDLR